MTKQIRKIIKFIEIKTIIIDIKNSMTRIIV